MIPWEPANHADPPVSKPASELAALRQRIAALEAAQASARQREAAVHLILAGLGQELREPLSVLILRVDLMLLEAEEHAVAPIVREDLAVLQRHLRRLARMVEVVPAAAGLDAGKRPLVDVDAVLQDTFALVTKPLEQAPGSRGE